MPFLSAFRPIRFAATLAALPGMLAAAAAEPKTQLAPFRVEAEFGPDGLRIQNSNAVLNQYLLDQHGVAQLQDISGLAPNLYSSNSDSRGFGDILALRGMANSIFFGGPSVALVIDDVPSGSVSSYPSALVNIESLAVKAGPQGTDYGRNAPGGIIDIKSRTPGAKHQGSLLVDHGSYESTTLQAAFDGPVTGQLGYSASFSFNQREGYIDNTLRRRPEDDRQAASGRAALYWKPDATLQLRLGALFEQVDDGAQRLSSLFSRDRYQVSSDFEGTTNIDRHQLSFQARKTLGWGNVIATTSKQRFDLDPSTTDLDLSALPLAWSRVIQSEDLWTQEVRLESAPAANQPQWRGGLFWSDSDIDGNALRQFVVPPSTFVPPGFVQTERTVFEIGQRTLAAYASLDQPLAPKTTLKLGARIERTRSDLDRTKAATNNFGFPSPQDAPLSRAQRDDYFSATAGLVHALSPALSVQARTSFAQKPEGFSGFTGVPSLAGFDREETWANEIGLTFAPPQGRFGGSILGFWNSIDGYQFERTVPNSTDFVVVNADAVLSRGVEAKFMFNPVERVWWDFSAGYTDATFDDHRDASGARVDGKHVPYIPTHTLRTGVTVDLGRGFAANASYVAIGKTHYDERNTALFTQRSYGIVNAQLRYRFERFTATVYGQNLFEEDYDQFINPEIFAGSPGAPRRFGVQLSFSY